MADLDGESELERLTREADEAEANLRRKKESLIPKDRVHALKRLFLAEAAAMATRVLGGFEDQMVAAQTEEDAQAIRERMERALDEGLERVKATIDEQMRAWTVAGLEDRAKDGLP